LRHASNPLAESVDIAPESLQIETALTVQGSIVRFTMKNREKSLWLVSENVLMTFGEDGFMSELFSRVAGQFVGPSGPGYRQPFILGPGQTYTSHADLRKNYAHLDMSTTRLPRSLTAGIAVFSSSEAANNFLLHVRSQPTFDPSIGMLPSQFKAHIVCPFRSPPH
jgi:hypothetical protein